ncbi:MAG: response regulator [Bacteroidota bacterium]
MKKKTPVQPLIKIGIVDDHKTFAQALSHSLSAQEEFTVAFVLHEGSHLMQELYVHQPDILLLDIKMKGEDGFTLLKKVKKNFPAVRVIMVSFHFDPSVILRCYQLGANSYFPKAHGLEDLNQAIHKVYRNNMHFSELSSKVLYENVIKNSAHQDFINCGMYFSEREKEIISLAAQGYENNQMAKMIKLSPDTLFTYRKRLLRKTGCNNMTELVVFALRHNIIVLP